MDHNDKENYSGFTDACDKASKMLTYKSDTASLNRFAKAQDVTSNTQSKDFNKHFWTKLKKIGYIPA